MTRIVWETSGVSNGTRGIFGGGQASSPTYVDIIDYANIATPGNAVDFGDLTTSRAEPAGHASMTRGLFMGGTTGSVSNIIDYITMASTGSATDFGDLTLGRRGHASSGSDPTAISAGGYATGYVNTIDYVTIASTGSATDFGDINAGSYYDNFGVNNETRMVMDLGYVSGVRTNTQEYVTVASTGNSVDFGDALSSASSVSGTSGD